jgi:pSer/pThr/pTyr-binding forkhead associated (FHA) protein
MIKIAVLSGPMDGDEFRTDKQVITLGRGPGHDVSLNLDPQVSQDHARITFEDGRYWLEDTGSTNGTFVGDQRITFKTDLDPDTVFRMGRTFLKIKVLYSEDEDQVVCKCGVKNVVSDKWCKNCGRELKTLIRV